MQKYTRLLFALLIGLMTVPSMLSAQERAVIDEIVAVVGSEIILKSDVDALLTSLVQQQQIPPGITDQRQFAFDELVNQKVLLNYAKQDTLVNVSEERVGQVLDDRINNLVQRAGSAERLEQIYSKSLLQLRTEYRPQIRNQLLVQDLQQNYLRDIKITPTEVKTWFAQFPTDSLPPVPTTVRVAHIVRYPDVDPAAKAEAQGYINAIQDSLQAGVPIEQLAQRYSDDPGSKPNGGRYQDFNINDLVPEFGAVAANLAPGEYSQIFETEYGFHIMRLNDRRGDMVDFNHVLINIDQNRVIPDEAIAYLTMVKDSLETHSVPFELLAKRHSQDPYSMGQGGYLTNPQTRERELPLEALGALWQNTLADLEVGDVSAPRETELLDGRKAWHIVWLQAYMPEHQISLETDYARIEQLALQAKQAREMTRWIETLRNDLFIKIKGDTKTAANQPEPDG